MDFFSRVQPAYAFLCDAYYAAASRSDQKERSGDRLSASKSLEGEQRMLRSDKFVPINDEERL